MKLLIISDIHGSMYYLDKILEIYKNGKYNKLIILGDILYHGPRNQLPFGYEPKAVIEELNKQKESIVAVRGNCDAEVDQIVLEFPITADYNSFYCENRTLFLTHGHIFSEDKLPSLQENDIFMYGHTHIPVIKKEKGILIFNPGSISVPRTDIGHTYGELMEDSLIIKKLDQSIVYQEKL